MITSQPYDHATVPACGTPAFLTSVEYDRTLQIENLVLSHLPLVRSISFRIRAGLPHHLEMDELVSAGLVGLVDAVHKYDPAKETQFYSYARFRIRGSILDFLRSLDWCPREVRKRKRSTDSVIQELTGCLGREPSEEEVAMASDLSLAEYQKLLKDVHDSTLLSINPLVNSEGLDSDELPITGPYKDDPLYRCIQNQTLAGIEAALNDLVERQRLVLTLYYYEELTMREIGDVLGIGESRVSQIHTSALKTLRAKLRSHDHASRLS